MSFLIPKEHFVAMLDRIWPFLIPRMKSLSNPYAVKTKTVENGKNYQFCCAMYGVTIYKGEDEEVGKVIKTQSIGDYGKPAPLHLE